MNTSPLHQGAVKKFYPDKGYGFIAPNQGGQDVFLHISQFRGAGPREFNVGDSVSYELEMRDKGPAALNVRINVRAEQKPYTPRSRE